MNQIQFCLVANILSIRLSYYTIKVLPGNTAHHDIPGMSNKRVVESLKVTAAILVTKASVQNSQERDLSPS